MPLLRLTQNVEQEDNFRIEIAFEDDDGARQTADVKFPYQFTKEDRADIRWYLEDYLQYPLDPAPKIAERIETRLNELGKELFKSIFWYNDGTKIIWENIRHRLKDTRVEIITDIAGAVTIPWELLRDPQTDAALALRAKSFVRGYDNPAQRVQLPDTIQKIRILLVICRPGGVNDVPFRSVANKLIKNLGDKEEKKFELDLLRPPSFSHLSKILRDAKGRGKPYNIVHFDGHGGYFEMQNQQIGIGGHVQLNFGRHGPHGYLAFENSQVKDNTEWIDGTSLGKLLVETDVSTLVLNACRSAHAEVLDRPDIAKEMDEHSQMRAYGSLAQEVMDAGVAGVVAMRYNVYVATAAQFVADLYAALAAGQTLGEAVSLGRKQLAVQPQREIAFAPRPLQDWSVPVVYEAAPISLFPKPSGAESVPLQIDISQTSKPTDDLPRPDVGFYGRDETLLALDRAFDRHQVVLLHTYAGSGKTMTAAEFARWYSQTGGLDGPVLFTSFEQYKPLERVLDTIGQVFGKTLENSGIQWLALSDEERLNVTMQVLKQIPVLWIWDNVEPVNGFPAGGKSVWTEKEQQELKMFMQIVTGQTKTKFLLTSRRDEQTWLGDFPALVSLQPMPIQEAVQLARALADKLGKKMTVVEDWKPLLKFTRGNPLTIMVVVGQALRDGIETRAQIKAYLEKLQKGEKVFEDETNEGRTKSLGASLSYGFDTAFSEDERKILALLHFFQGFVDVDVLVWMGKEEQDYRLPELHHLTREDGILLLDKASEIGLLTAIGDGYYTIHPALPWFFRKLFEQYYPEGNEKPLTVDDSDTIEVSSSRVAHRAFVESIGAIGNYYTNQYEDGSDKVIAPLHFEETNLLYARQLARQNAWWDALISTMLGLNKFYYHMGRRAEWKRLVEEIVPDFVSTDDLPLPGHEEHWSFIMYWRYLLSREERNLPRAEQLARKLVENDRNRAANLLFHQNELLNNSQKRIIHSLANSLANLGRIQSEMGQPDCISSYQEAKDLSHRIADYLNEAEVCIDIGNAYKNLPTLRNLEKAESWYQLSLELRPESDRVGRGKCHNQLGIVAHIRMKEAQQAISSGNQIQEFFDDAVRNLKKALELKPSSDIYDLAVTHTHLGNVFGDGGQFEESLYHHRKAAKFFEATNAFYDAASVQFNFAITSVHLRRFDDALLYARAALHNFESYGQGAEKDIADIKKLIEGITQVIGAIKRE